MHGIPSRIIATRWCAGTFYSCYQYSIALTNCRIQHELNNWSRLPYICFNPLANIVYYNLGHKLEEERTKWFVQQCTIGKSSIFKGRYTTVGSSCSNNECHVNRITCALSYHNNLKLLPGSHCNKYNRAYLMLFLIIGIDGKHQFCYGVGDIMLLQIMFTNKA